MFIQDLLFMISKYQCITGNEGLFVVNRFIVTHILRQLRDLLLTDKQFEDEIVVPAGRDIVKYNYINEKRECILEDIGYNSTCIASG
jgi:hypothetical protein